MLDAIIIGTSGLDDPAMFWFYFVIYNILITVFAFLFVKNWSIAGGIHIIVLTLFFSQIANISNSSAKAHEEWLGETKPSGIEEYNNDIEGALSQNMICLEGTMADIEKNVDENQSTLEFFAQNTNTTYFKIITKFEPPKWYQNNIHFIKPTNITIIPLGKYVNFDFNNYKQTEHNIYKYYQNSFYYYDSIFNHTGESYFALPREDVTYNSAGDPLDFENKHLLLYCDSNNWDYNNNFFCQPSAVIDGIRNECYIDYFSIDGDFAHSTAEKFNDFKKWNLDRSKQNHWEERTFTEKIGETENTEHRYRSEEYIKILKNSYLSYGRNDPTDDSIERDSEKDDLIERDSEKNGVDLTFMLSFLIYLILPFLSAYLASSRGKSKSLWFFLTLIFPLAVFFIAMKDQSKED